MSSHKICFDIKKGVRMTFAKSRGCEIVFNVHAVVKFSERFGGIPVEIPVKCSYRVILKISISRLQDILRPTPDNILKPLPSYDFFLVTTGRESIITLRWRHNGHDSVSNHQPRECLLNSLIRCRSKKTSKLRVTGLCEGNSPETGEFPAQRTSNAENVSIWWRHHRLQLVPVPILSTRDSHWWKQRLIVSWFLVIRWTQILHSKWRVYRCRFAMILYHHWN